MGFVMITIENNLKRYCKRYRKGRLREPLAYDAAFVFDIAEFPLALSLIKFVFRRRTIS